MEENKNLMTNEEENKENENANEEAVVTEETKTSKIKDFVVNNKKQLIIAGVAVVGAIVLGKTLIKNDTVVQELVESTEVMDTVTDVVKDIVDDVVTPE